MTLVAAIGHLSRDIVAGAPPRPGGGVFYAAHALSHLGLAGRIAASCAAEDRPTLFSPLESLGLDVAWYESSTTTAYRFHYEGDRRVMWQDAVGDSWTPERAVDGAGGAHWVDVCALTRADFPTTTLSALARERRRLLIDAQGLVRTGVLGPLRIDGNIGDALRHVDVLKLDDEEAATLVGSADVEAVRGLGVPEVLLTRGSHGSWVITPSLAEHVPAVGIEGVADPTGAGDTYAAAYLAHRARGAEPVEAARAAAETVSWLLRS